MKHMYKWLGIKRTHLPTWMLSRLRW